MIAITSLFKHFLMRYLDVKFVNSNYNWMMITVLKFVSEVFITLESEFDKMLPNKQTSAHMVLPLWTPFRLDQPPNLNYLQIYHST